MIMIMLMLLMLMLHADSSLSLPLSLLSANSLYGPPARSPRQVLREDILIVNCIFKVTPDCAT